MSQSIPRPSNRESTTYVLAAGSVPPGSNVVLPRFGNSHPEDALAAAATRGSGAALTRLMEQFSSFRFDLAATTTDDNRMSTFDLSVAEGAAEDEVLDLASVTRDLTRTYGCPVTAELVTAPMALAWRRYDTLVIQQETTSKWSVNEPQELSALPGFTPEEPSANPVWEGDLGTDQAMYVPRGWAVELQSIADPSQCAVVSVQRWTGLDILRAMSLAGGHWPLLRADAPVDVAAHTDSYDGHLYRENNFGDLLQELASIEQVDSSLALLQVGVHPEDELSSLAASELLATTPVRLLCPTGVKWLDHDDQCFTVALSGRALTISMTALPAFTEVAAGEPFRIADLPLTVTADGAETLVRELNSLGLITLASS